MSLTQVTVGMINGALGSNTALDISGAGGTGAAQIPSGNTAQRPSSPTVGYLRFNTDTGVLENYTANGWFKVSVQQPTISNISGSIYSGNTSTLTISGQNFGTANANVTFSGANAASVIDLLAKFDLRRGDQGLKVIMMCELPSNAVLADEFLKYFDGFSIGSNDMTQLTLGLDRDSGDVAHLFDERNAAVKIMLKMAIDAATKAGKYVGICGQGPSDHEDLAEWLMEQGISSVSLNPDTVIDTWLQLGKVSSK